MGSEIALGGGQQRGISMFHPRRRALHSQLKLVQLLKTRFFLEVKQRRENLASGLYSMGMNSHGMGFSCISLGIYICM